MATWLIDSGTLTDIADAIRAKTGSAATIQVSDLATEIANLPSGGTTINGATNINVIASEALDAGDRIKIEVGNRLASPPSTTKSVKSIDINGTETSCAVGLSQSPYIAIYDMGTSPWTKLNNPGTTPAGAANNIKFSPDGSKCAVAHNTSPYITVYDTTTNPWTKLTDANDLPGGNAYGVAWNNTGDNLTVCCNSSPYFITYDTTTTPFTKKSNPANLPSSTCYSVAYNSAGTRLAVGSSNTLFLYDATTSPYTRLSTKTTSNQIYSLKFYDNDSKILAQLYNMPYLKIYSATTLNEETITIDISMENNVDSYNGTVINKTGDKIFYGTSNYNNFAACLYNISGTTLSYILPFNYLGNVYAAAFFDNDSKIIIGIGSAPYLYIYDLTNFSASKFGSETCNVRNGYGYTKENIASGATGQASLLFR